VEARTRSSVRGRASWWASSEAVAKELGVAPSSMRKSIKELYLTIYSFPEGYVFLEGSVPAHKSKKLQQWCKEELDELDDFWPWDLWPPSSPDLNPLDYHLGGILESKAWASSHPSTDSLKAAIEREWAAMSMDNVVKACKVFGGMLKAMIKARGGHFERSEVIQYR